MKTITALETQRGNQERVNVYLDGQFAFGLDALVAAKENLTVGRSLSDEELGKLGQQDELQRCYDAALRFLGYRPRSEAEVRQRLRKRGFPEEIIDGVIVKLREQRFLDDVAFAQFWLENRQAYNPRGERLLRQELRQKGVETETIKELTDDLEESEAAYRAARKKVQSLSRCEFKEFRQRLGAFLARRGFNYETASEVVGRLWRERESGE